ncbi:MAG: hypothetical protein JKY61_07900 [Planctomycetes bacterium]|nr:hypothetical protein [Planctomycetota bacterium]
MSDPRKWVRPLRRATYILATVGILYLGLRYSVYSLNASNEVLPMRFETGQRVLLDTRPRPPEVGDAFLVRTAQGGLALGVVQKLEDQRLAFIMGRTGWSESDWLWIPRGDLQARVLFILPF